MFTMTTLNGKKQTILLLICVGWVVALLVYTLISVPVFSRVCSDFVPGSESSNDTAEVLLGMEGIVYASEHVKYGSCYFILLDTSIGRWFVALQQLPISKDYLVFGKREITYFPYNFDLKLPGYPLRPSIGIALTEGGIETFDT